MPLPESLPSSQERRWARGYHRVSALYVLDVGLRAVGARGGLGVPFAVGRLVLDGLGAAGYPLFRRRAPCGGKRGIVTRKALGKRAIDGIGPTAVMLNDFVDDMGHLELVGLGRVRTA